MHKKRCYWLIFKKACYLYSKYHFKFSSPNKNGTELFSMIVPSVTKYELIYL